MQPTAHRGKSLGLPPGTLVHVGPARAGPVVLTAIDYSESSFEEREVSVDECRALKETPTVTWINVDGIHDVEVIRRLGEVFGLHPLLLEDVANTTQRPKLEDYGDALFVVLKMLYVKPESSEIGSEQVSLVIGENFVLSFQERRGDVFETVRDRLREARGRVRSAGADYLGYALIDAVVDNYFLILEGMSERIEHLEEELATDGASAPPRRIHGIKRQVLLLRKSVWPLREVVGTLGRGELRLISHQTLPYLRDVYDHTIQVVDTIETFRDMISGLRDTYLTLLSNRMNEVMKVLTIIATIFIPLTFIAGVYGMNFKHMPELEWKWAYPAVWGLMLVIAAGMIVYFKRKRWL